MCPVQLLPLLLLARGARQGRREPRGCTCATMATRATRGATSTATSAATTPLERELEQAKGGTHPRIVAEEKRLTQQKTGLQAKADQMRKYRLSIVEAQFESERRAAEEVFARDKGIVQNRLIEECIDRQKRHSKVRQPAPAPREKGRPRPVGGCTHRRTHVAGGQVGAERGDA